MAAAAVYRDPGEFPAAVLSVTVHVLLALFLFFGVRWQTRQPEAVVVELWDRPPVVQPPKVEEPPKVEPKPEPPKVEPRPEPKPEPKAEPKPSKPDIAVEREKKPAPKKEEPPLKIDRQQAIREQLAREMETVKREREKREVLSKFEAPPAGPRIDASYANKIRTKIRSSVVLPPEVKGNPEAIFDVIQLPTGEVMSVKLRRSSGNKVLDDAWERAILKSSPLPKPDRPEQFARELTLRFRPVE